MKDEKSNAGLSFILHPSAFIPLSGDVAQLDKQSVGLVNRTIRVRLPSSPPNRNDEGGRRKDEVTAFAISFILHPSYFIPLLWRSQVGKAPDC